MAVKRREYLISVNEFNEPSKLEGESAIGLLLLRLFLLEPGSDPLHPTMGLGLRNYRYGVNNLEELKKKLEYQIDTFLPTFQDTSISLVMAEGKKLNIEINVNGTVYVYDSSNAPVPLYLSDIENS